MSHILNQRFAQWHRFRDQMVLRAKAHFIYYLSIRGYTGKMSFNHEEQRLHLKVQIDPTRAFSGASHHSESTLVAVAQNDTTSISEATLLSRDTRSLSGGERSFTTLAFLLALWEAIECPFRCLDEFDVFMDAVNRRLCMKLLIEMARTTSHSRQYILITPQDMSTISLGNDTRVHRLRDPERGQSTLFDSYS
jgi:hypothetical protein